MEYVLETNNLCKRYRGFTALSGLSMHVPKGAIYGFVGRNGAGKTTLIRLICGLQQPTEGSYSLYGVRHTRHRPQPPQNGRGGGDSLDLHGYDRAGKPDAAVPGAGAALV